jgi:hypothetical protein
MTCDEYLAIVATAPVGEMGESHLREHAVGCHWCNQVTRVVVDRESSLIAAFESVSSRTAPAVTVNVAVQAWRRRRVALLVDVTLAIAIAVTMWFATADKRARDSGDSTAGEPVVEEVFMIRCLSSAQAGALTRLHLGPQGIAAYTGEPPRAVLTVRAPFAQIEELRAVMSQYEGAGGSACPTPVAPPPIAR